MTQTITYKIVDNAGIARISDDDDDYIGIAVYLDGVYQTCLTGFLKKDIAKKLLSGEAKEITNGH